MFYFPNKLFFSFFFAFEFTLPIERSLRDDDEERKMLPVFGKTNKIEKVHDEVHRFKNSNHDLYLIDDDT